MKTIALLVLLLVGPFGFAQQDVVTVTVLGGSGGGPIGGGPIYSVSSGDTILAPSLVDPTGSRFAMNGSSTVYGAGDGGVTSSAIVASQAIDASVVAGALGVSGNSSNSPTADEMGFPEGALNNPDPTRAAWDQIKGRIESTKLVRDSPSAAAMDASDIDITMDIEANVRALAPAMQRGAAFANSVTKYTAFAYGTAAAVVMGVPTAASLTARAIGWSAGLAGGTGVVLGQYAETPNYIDAANQIGASRFNLWTPVYNALDTMGEAWTANQAFLNASIFRGQQFYLSTPPQMANNTFLMELQYLTSRGIGSDRWLMVSPYLSLH